MSGYGRCGACEGDVAVALVYLIDAVNPATPGAKPGTLKRLWPGVSYCCPSCNAVLGVQRQGVLERLLGVFQR